MSKVTPQDLVESLETAGVKLATQEVMTYLAAEVWVGFGSIFISPIAAYFVSIIVGILFIQIDWVAFTLKNGWMSTQQGKDFLKAVKKRVELSESASAQEIKDAEQDQIFAFRNLVKLDH